MKKIGILIICTGNYTIFFDELYESSEKFFLKENIKTYYVFTDGIISHKKNVKIIHQKVLGWPYDTMMRFHMFNSISDILEKEDYLFFLNANMVFNDYVNEEVIPNESNNFLMGVNHPGFYNTTKENYSYERRKESSFYISNNDGNFYFQGCFNGGRSKEFLEMSKFLSEKIDEDLNKNIIPIWHDESALNWYYKDKNPLILSPGYAYPETWNLPFEKKLIQVDKNKFGGHNNLRKNK